MTLAHKGQPKFQPRAVSKDQQNKKRVSRRGERRAKCSRRPEGEWNKQL